MRASCVGRSTLAFTASLCLIWKVISQLRYSSRAVPSSAREALSSRFSDPFTHRMYSDFEGFAIVVLPGWPSARDIQAAIVLVPPAALYHPEVLPRRHSPQIGLMLSSRDRRTLRHRASWQRPTT